MFDLAAAVVFVSAAGKSSLWRWAVGALWVWFRVCVRRAWCVRGCGPAALERFGTARV